MPLKRADSGSWLPPRWVARVAHDAVQECNRQHELELHPSIFKCQRHPTRSCGCLCSKPIWVMGQSLRPDMSCFQTHLLVWAPRHRWRTLSLTCAASPAG
jgi:hypothetical protein